MNRDFAHYTTHALPTAPSVAIYLVATVKADWHFTSLGVINGLRCMDMVRFALNKND